MWIVMARASAPDARYWPGRRLLALLDAVAWPSVAAFAVASVQMPTGIAGTLLVALCVLAAAGRALRAVRFNHRYHFTTWPWVKVFVAMLALGMLLKLAS